MAVWYEGNLNNAENRREENGVVYYIRGVRVVDGARGVKAIWRCCAGMWSR